MNASPSLPQGGSAPVVVSQSGRRWRGLAGAGALILLIAVGGWLVWRFVLSTPDAAPDRRVIQEITLVTPPPPPPPEPEEVIEEQEEVIEPTEDTPVKEDVETPSDEPNDQPAESSEAAGLDKPADAGSDSFRLAAGGGGGFFGRGGGGGGGSGDWGGYVETHIRRALQRDQRTRTAQGFLRVNVNIGPTGQFLGASLRSSTGDAKLDAAVRDVLSSLPPLGRSRPARQDGLTNVTINMKRTVG